jgi:uncharacterized membrane protein YozB (DUF420 family)
MSRLEQGENAVMPKLPTYLQGLIVVVIAVIVGIGLLQIIGNNEDEGFLGTSKTVTGVSPIVTEEPPEPGAQPTLSPASTEEPSDGQATPAASATPTDTGLIREIETDFKSPLGADGNLVYQIAMGLGLVFGASFAVRKDFVSHRNVMTFLIIVNWFSIVGRMTDTFGDIADLDVNENLARIHAGLGGITMIFASYLALRMWFENQLPGWIKIDPIKTWMRLTLVLWLTLIVLGVLIYIGIYS